MVYLRIAMLQAIGNHQPFGFMYRIVARCLIKSSLCNLYGGCFTFYDHDPFPSRIEDDYICSFLQFIEAQSPFDLDQRPWEFFLQYQVLDEMLSYPFFRCKYQVFPADLIEYKMRFVLQCNLKGVLR